MSIVRFAVVLPLSMLLAAGCNNDSRSSSPAASASAPAPVLSAPSPSASAAIPIPSATTELRLLDPGTAPVRPLRYQFDSNKPETMLMTMRSSFALDLGGGKRTQSHSPDVSMTLLIEPQQVLEDGSLRYSFRLTQVQVQKDPRVGEAMMNSLQQRTRALEGLHGSAVVTPQGQTREASVELPKGTDPHVEQLLDSLRQSVTQLSAPFPEQPVGRGARWQTVSPLRVPNLQMRQVTTYTLQEAQGDTLRIGVITEQQTEPLTATGRQEVIDKLDATGKGTLQVNLKRLVPTTDLNVESQIVTRAPGPGGTRESRVIVHLQTSIRPLNQP